MNTYKKHLLSILLLLLFPMVAFADVAWTVLIAGDALYLPTIVISLLLEYFLFKYLFTLNKKTALRYTLVANIVSTLCGVVLIPFSRVLFKPLTDLGASLFIFTSGNISYEHPPTISIFIPILGGAVSALLELLTIRVIWKQKLRGKNYFLTWCVNTVTIPLITFLEINIMCNLFLCS